MPKVSYRRKYEYKDTISERLFEVRIEGKHPLVTGKEVTFRGERGRFKFKWAREMEDGRYELTVYGGTKRYQSYRTFTSDRVKAVHYKEKLRK